MSGVEVSRVDGRTVATVTGDMELGTVPEMAVVLEELGTSHGSVLVIDLTAVTFLDSSGLSLLVRLHRRLCDQAGEARFVCAPTQLRLLQLTGLDQVFPLYSVLSDAVEGNFPRGR